MSRRGWVLFAAMCVIWGIPYLLIKVAVDNGISPPLLVFLRTAGGSLLLVPVAAARGQLRPLLARWPTILGYTLVEVAVPWLLLSHAETTIASSLTGLLMASVPLFGALLSPLSGDRLDALRWTGLLVGVAGVAALLGLDMSGGNALALLEVLVTAACYATGPVIVRRRLADMPSTGVIAASLLLSAVICAPLGLSRLPARMPTAGAVTAVALLAFVCTALAFVVFFALIAEVGPPRATVINYVHPAVAVLLGVTVLSEPFTAGTAIGFPLVLAGCYLATRRARPLARAAATEAAPAEFPAVAAAETGE